MEKYLTWLLDNGAQTISICGSTGENIAMNMEEQREIIAHVSSFLAGQVPLVCGTGRYDTLNTIKMSKFAQDHGADCVMVILPFYLNPHKKAVLQHFRDIRAALDIDIMVYNNPWFAGYELNTEEVKSLVDDGTIQCIKAAHGDPNRVHELKFACGDKLTVFYGHDYWRNGRPALRRRWLAVRLPGGPAEAVPRSAGCLLRRRRQGCRAAQDNIQPYINYFFYDKVNGVPHWQEICKYTLQAQGLDYVGLPRKPLGELDEANKRKIEKILADMK